MLPRFSPFNLSVQQDVIIATDRAGREEISEWERMKLSNDKRALSLQP